MVKKLFRQQAVDHRANRLYGDVFVLPRLSHTLIAGFLLAWVLLLVIWLVTSTYDRKETVQGWLEPSEGIVRVYARADGIIKQVLVADGDVVVPDQPLIIVDGDRRLASGEDLEKLLLGEYEAKHKLLSDQLARTNGMFDMRKHDVEERIAAVRKELALLDRQTATLEERHKMAAAQTEKYQKLTRDGHISAVTLDTARQQELELLSDAQELSRVQINQQNLLQQLLTESQLLPDEHSNTIGQLRSQLSDLAQEIAQLHGEHSYTIKAVRPGVVSNLQVWVGQSVRGDIPLLSIVPNGAVLAAHLIVPVRAAGFVKEGQPLEIRYDAFPYEKFGLYHGQVTGMSRSVLLPNELLSAPITSQEPVYKVYAQLNAPVVNAYGQEFQLKPGMTFSADIRLESRTLLEWLLEPFYSIKGRL
jgi:membrane fusion protein